MRYFDDMLRILRLDDGLWAELSRDPRVMRYAVANVLVLGLIYGVSALYFSQRLLVAKGFSPEATNLNAAILFASEVHKSPRN